MAYQSIWIVLPDWLNMIPAPLHDLTDDDLTFAEACIIVERCARKRRRNKTDQQYDRPLTKKEQADFATGVAENQRRTNEAMKRIREGGESIDLSDASPR